MATLELNHLTKRFGAFTAVNGLELQAADGEMIALLGGSGCGKTTTLRMIAGFLDPDAGTILVNGRDVSKIPPYKRNIGIFFQNYALFPHMTVFENVAFGLKLQKLKKPEIEKRVKDILELVKLVGFDRRYPRELSGGQQQRVALARALVTRPSILLLDEPLSNLDAKLRTEMQVEIKRIQKELSITTIIVTHDHEEAVSLADRVIVMHEGRILQIGTPEEVFDRPNSPFVADFMGFSTFIHGIMGPRSQGELRPVLCSGRQVLVSSGSARSIEDGASVLLGIRSENLHLVQQPGENTYLGRIDALTYKGTATRLEINGAFAETLYPAVHGYIPQSVGQNVYVHIPSQGICVYKTNQEENEQ